MKKAVRKSNHKAKKPAERKYIQLPKSLKELDKSYQALVRELAKR